MTTYVMTNYEKTVMDNKFEKLNKKSLNNTMMVFYD